jgi:dolichyl-phosphate-mannose--protein O-mannosyl transferase
MQVNKAIVNVVLIFLCFYFALVWDNTDRDSFRYIFYMLLNVAILFSVVMFNKQLFVDIYTYFKELIYGKPKEAEVVKEDKIKKFIE